MFIKAFKEYIRQYMVTKKWTNLICTYAKALAAENKLNTAYKNANGAQAYKKPCEWCSCHGPGWKDPRRLIDILAENK